MRSVFKYTRALIFVVDSSDHERMSEADDMLKSLLREDGLQESLVLVLANKQDLPNAKSPAAISDAFELHKVRQQCRKDFQGTSQVSVLTVNYIFVYSATVSIRCHKSQT